MYNRGVGNDIEQHDGRTRRCPMLGHEVRFAYCRAPGRELPCGRVLDCWFETFDVEAFIRVHYSGEQIDEILAPRPDKVASLVELIEKARRGAGGGPESA